MADAIELKNSCRMLEKVTYTPVTIAGADGGGGAVEIAVAVRGLNLLPGEALDASHQVSGRASDTLQIIEQLASGDTPAARLAAASRLAGLPTSTLTAAVGEIRKRRQGDLNDCVALLREITGAYLAAQKQDSQRSAEIHQLSDRMSFIEERLSVALSTKVPGLLSSPHEAAAVAPVRQGALAPLPQRPLPARAAALLGADIAPQVPSAVSWAQSEQPSLIPRLLDRAASVIPAELRANAESLIYDGLAFLIDQTGKTAAIETHLNQRSLQPMGLLHLEQLVTTPLAVERGELIYSLPLAPDEKVTLSHKEWTLREEEYTRFVQDYLENYSERGVAQATDIAASSRSETEHTKTLSMSKPSAPGGATLADPVDMTAAGAGDVTKETQSQEQSRRDTRSVTEKASTLAIRDQKISFTVATTSGTEDFTARLYENKKPDKLMMIEYFRRMRRWRNDLYRVGIRLTYDVVLPDPGRRLRERWLQLKVLDSQIAAPFEFTLGVKSSSAADPSIMTSQSQYFTYHADFDAMTPEDLEMLARQYGTTLQPSPETLTALEDTIQIRGAGAATESVASVTVPDDYRAVRVHIGGRMAITNNPDVHILGSYWEHQVDIPDPSAPDDRFYSASFDVHAQDYASRSIAAGFIAYNGATGEGRIRVDLVPSPAKMRAWRASVWDQLRQAALARFNEKREGLRQQRVALLNELEAADTLTLRRMEREQIMYLVLEWLFPDFGKSKDIEQSLTSSALNAWETVLEYGEYIKFVHDAIDWDGLLVLLYPYFWGRSDTHADKLYLDHPDGAHREFLRAGAARVIIAIKPGYERQVVSLLDQGKLGALAPASRFEDLIVAVEATEKEFAEMRAKALAPFEEGEDPADRPPIPGVLIGQWFEYTPTSALDADVTLRPLLE